MPKTKAVSPARSQGGITTPKRKPTRGSRSLCSPALSTASGRLTSLIDQFKDKNMDSFALSPLNGRSVLNDNTEIEEPRRKSWWKKLDENSQDVMEVLQDNKLTVNNPIEEFIDIDVLSQEKKNYTLDLPESSDNESIHSIVLPQRRLFTQKENQPQKKYGHLMDNRESLAKLHKTNNTHIDKSVNVGTRELFQNTKRSKPIFPAALLNISPDKTVADKTKGNDLADPKPQVRNIFGNRPANKRKNMFADFIVSESEDEIPDIQPKVFGFQKKLEQRRISSVSRGRESSPASSITTDIEMDFRMMLPSSTMVENQLEDMVASTPVKRARLSKLSEAKESEAGTLQTNTTSDKTKQSNKSASSKNKSKASPDIKDKSFNSSRTTRSMLKNASKHEENVNTSLKKNAKGDKSKSKITSRLNELDVSLSKTDTDKQSVTLNKSSQNQNKSKTRNSLKAMETEIEEENCVANAANAINNATRLINKSRNKSLPNTTNKSVHEKVDETLINDDVQNEEEDDEHNFTLEYEHDDEVLDEAEVPSDNRNDNTKKHNTIAIEKDNQKAEINKSKSNKSSVANKTIQKPTKTVEESVESQTEQYSTDDNVDGNQEPETQAAVQDQENKDEEMDDQEMDDKAREDMNNEMEQEDEGNVSQENEEDAIESEEEHDEVKISQVANESQEVENENEEDEDQANESQKVDNKENDNEEDEDQANQIQEVENEEIENEEDEDQCNESHEVENEKDESQTNESQEVENVENEEDQNQPNESQKEEAEVNESQKIEEDEQNENQGVENEEEDNESEKEEDQANGEQEVEIEREKEENEANETQEVANESHEAENEEENESEDDNDEGNQSQEIETELNESQEIANDSQEVENKENESDEDEDQPNESQEIEAEVNESQEIEEDQASEIQEIEEEANESQIDEDDEAPNQNEQMDEEDEEAANDSQINNASVNESQEVENDEEENNEVQSDTEVNESEEIEDDQQMEDSDEADKAIATDAEISDQDDNQTDEMEVDKDEEESDSEESEQDEQVSHEERQIEEHNEIEPSEEIVEESPNVTHDTTGRHRNKNLNKSPEVILHDKTNQMDSFTAQGRNTSVRKTKSMIKNLNIRPSLAPPRDSTGFSDGTRNSSAEGSGWDSHRTTRKTLRQTFGKDFTPRKSLRALVMEKSAKRQTEHIEMHSETVKFPLANSTEMPEDSNHNVEDVESDHELSRRTRQTTLEQYLQKIKEQNIEKKLKMEAAIRNSLKTPVTNSLSLFKVPGKPAPRRPKPSQSKPKKQIKSVIPLDELPPEVIEDMKYKPPKRFQPTNASWITKRLYKFLETKLEPKYDYKARVRAEKLVETIYSFAKDLRRHHVAPADAVDVLKHELARLDVVRTHFDFYEFFHEFMPREVRIKVVPDIVNKIALPRHGVFSDILRGNTVHG